MCNPKNYSDSPATSKSTVEELHRPIPSLFRALTEGDAPINMMVVSFPVAEELSHHENLVSFLESLDNQHQNVSVPGKSIHTSYDTQGNARLCCCMPSPTKEVVVYIHACLLLTCLTCIKQKPNLLSPDSEMGELSCPCPLSFACIEKCLFQGHLLGFGELSCHACSCSNVCCSPAGEKSFRDPHGPK